MSRSLLAAGLVVASLAALAAGEANAPRTLPLVLRHGLADGAPMWLSFNETNEAELQFAGRTFKIRNDNGSLRIDRDGDGAVDGPGDVRVGPQGVFRLPFTLGGRPAEFAFQAAVVEPGYGSLSGFSRLEASDADLALALVDADRSGTFAGQVQVRNKDGWAMPQQRARLVSAAGSLWELSVAKDLTSLTLTPWAGETAQVEVGKRPVEGGPGAFPAFTTASIRLRHGKDLLVLDLKSGAQPVLAVPGTYVIEQSRLEFVRPSRHVEPLQDLCGSGGSIELKPGPNQILLAYPDKIDFTAGVFSDGSLVQLDAPGLVDELGSHYRIQGGETTCLLRLGTEEKAVTKLEYG